MRASPAACPPAPVRVAPRFVLIVRRHRARGRLLDGLLCGLLVAWCLGGGPGIAPSSGQEPLAGTEALTWDGDLASRMVAGADRFLLAELEASIAKRPEHWNRDDQRSGYWKSLQPQRERLRHLLGLRDPRIAPRGLQFEQTTEHSALLAEADRFRVYQVSWPALEGIRGRGLLLEPRGEAVANVIVLPDADQTPEQLAGLSASKEKAAPAAPTELTSQQQVARRLAAAGCRVVVPSLISRTMERRNGRAVLSHREYVHRSAYELGRHLIGYELQKVFAAADWFTARHPETKLGLWGYGEGAMLALYAGALDERFAAVSLSGHFDSRQTLWQQPIDRNVFGLLEQFGDAELASMIAPRPLVIEACRGPEVELSGAGGGAPAKLTSPQLASVQAEYRRLESLTQPLGKSATLIISGDRGQGDWGSREALAEWLQGLGAAGEAPALQAPRGTLALRRPIDESTRQQLQVAEIDRFNQRLLVESPYVRAKFMERLDTSSLEKYRQSVESYRDYFRTEIVGEFQRPRLPANPRTRKIHDQPKWEGYEVVLDVFPDVFAYGILLLPKGIKPGEKRPVVVCQHGLEGRPQDVVTGDHPAYHDFAAKLAERGFITFAPQNLYIFKDRFRTLQRKAYPLKKTLFSLIVPQHQQITDWLKQLPGVDPARIAFYGLSYGGKSAMRIPPLVDNYCLSICSADFNDWVWKNASSRAPYSYVWTGEYEIFEFDLGSTFNYSEMAALICPRPFMVERGHFDGVAPDDRVAAEFAKVRFLYQARLKLPNRCEIEFFDGPHTINGKGTFAFLHRHLNWPAQP